MDNGTIYIDRLWRHYQRASVRMVYEDLQLDADEQGDTTTTINRLCVNTGLSRPTVQAALRTLVATGDLTATRYGNEMTYHLTRYDEPMPSRPATPPPKAEEQPAKRPVSDEHAQFKMEVFCDAKIEQAMMSLRITADEYLRLANEVISDWEFGDVPEKDWNFFHLLSTMRIKKRENERNTNNRNGTTSRQDTINAAAQAMAALAAKSGQVIEPPF